MNPLTAKLLFPVWIGLLAASCRPESAGKPSWSADTIALVGKVPLYQKDLDHALSLAGNRSAQDTLEELAGEEALAQLALAEGVADDPSVRSAMRRLLASRVREKHLHTAPVDPAAIAEALAKEQASAPVLPPQYQLAFLRQRFSTAGSEQAAVAALEKARADIASLPPDVLRRGFGTLAAEFSDDTDTRYQGGTAGWVVPGKSHLLVPDSVTLALTALKQPGLLPEIIRSADAAWLGMVTEIKTPAAAKPQTSQIEARLHAKNAEEQAASLLFRARATNPLTILHLPLPSRPGSAPSLPPTPPQ